MLQIDKKTGLLISDYYFSTPIHRTVVRTFVIRAICLNLIMSGQPHNSGIFYLALSVLLLCSGPVSAQLEVLHVRQVDTIETTLDLFGEAAPMNITLTFDIKKYQREKFKGEYMPVHFRYQLNDTLHLDKEMRLKARGSFRRNHCSLAPFWLDVRKTDQENEDSAGFHRIKIVTHCKGSQAYNEYVLKEYLCYKIYNLITPVSFRVRLVRMTYVDTGRKNKPTEGWAFMIEPQEMLAKRLEAVEVQRDDLSTSLLRPWEMDILAVFQYMIGNVDYSIYGGQNIKFLGLPGFGSAGYSPVPYDFDYTGFVDTYYAIPSEFTGINSVRDRYYLGPCREEGAYEAAIEHINRLREEIFRLVEDFEYLDQKHKLKVLDYLEEYFESSERPKSLISSFQRTCI